MGILNSLRRFFEGFIFKGYAVFKEVQADFPPEIPRGTAVAGKDGLKKRRDILGNIIYEQNFVFLLKMPAQFEVDRQENHDFIGELENWVFMKNQRAELPVLEEGKKARSIEFAGGSLKEIQSDGSAVYALDILFTYERNNDYGN